MAQVYLTEESDIKYNSLSDLSYNDPKTDDVDLFVKGEYCGKIDVFTDRENNNREYICINYEIIYLDTITLINPESF